MKKRIVALVLVVVMSILTLSSCGSSFDIGSEDFSGYVEFKYDDFKKALDALEIEDGEFTTNEETRVKLVAAKIYNAIADKVIAATKEADRNTSFEEGLTSGDVLYFVYYATMKDSEGNDVEFYRSHMDVTNLTKSGHVIKLGANFDEKKDAFSFLLKAALENVEALNPYSTKTKAQLEADFVEAWEEEHGTTYVDAELKFKTNYKTEHPDATDDEVNSAFTEFKNKYAADKANATKVQEGKTYYVSYTREYETPLKGKGEITVNEDGVRVDEDGKKVDENGNRIDENGNIMYNTVKENAAYQEITLSASNPLHALLLHEKATACVGDTAFKAFISEKDGVVKTDSKFTVTDPAADTAVVKDGKYTYSAFSIKWMVEKSGTPIIFKHTPETKEANTNKDGVVGEKLTDPDSIYKADGKLDIVGQELTYYIFPVYAIDAPSAEEITPYEILYHLYGSKLTENSFEVLGEEYKNGEETVKSLVEDIAKIFVKIDTVKADELKDNEFYKNDTEKTDDLRDLLDDYQAKLKEGGSNPKGEKKEAIDNAKKKLTDAQDVLLKGILEKIVAAKDADGNLLGDEIYKYDAEAENEKFSGEYYHNNYHALKESYDSDIIKKVQIAVWELIDKSVTVNLDKIPEKLLEDYVDHLYESYEYDFYKGYYKPSNSTGTTSSTETNYKHYGTFDKYLNKVVLGIDSDKKVDKDALNKALDKEAKEYLEPIIKIFVVAQHCNDDAKAVLKSYVQADIDAGKYTAMKEAYEEEYGDEAEAKIEEHKATELKDAESFLVDDDFMKLYKKEIGNANYNRYVEANGDINLRTAFQFDKLFYYLTSTYMELNEDGDHMEVVYKDGKLDFKTVNYTIKVEDTNTETEGDAE